MGNKFEGMDEKELDFADTVFVRDIDNRVFQSIAMQCIAGVKGVVLAQGGLLDNFLGRDQLDSRLKAISASQSQKDRSVSIKVELHIEFGLSIPEKSEEIQGKISREIIKLTGMHVSSVHVVFKNVFFKKLPETKILPDAEAELIEGPV